VRMLLEQRPASGHQEATRSVFSLPWAMSSLKGYLEEHGPPSLRDANRWIESFRLGDPYAPVPKGDLCLSTQP
jgi:hypothetical protein